MTTVVISPSNVVTFPEGGGHFWVYMQYVAGFQRQGCDVYWLEQFVGSGDPDRDDYLLSEFRRRMDRFGLGERVILYRIEPDPQAPGGKSLEYLLATRSFAESVCSRADLLVNFHYGIDSIVLQRFKRSALVDIDPGLLQFWIANDQLIVQPHDLYFTTGENVGAPNARFPDCGLDWRRIRPPVALDLWPYHFDPGSEAFTTISSWWGGGGKGEFITDGKGVIYENNKRVTFLDYVTLPESTSQALELALNLGDGDDEESNVPEQRVPGVTDYVSDAVDRRMLESHGWRLRNAYEVADSPETYQSYIQSSRGEFSCVKPSCIEFQNAWISDRTICYLASGKPVVVQDTGPSGYLPNGEGMFRFSSLEQAEDALSMINADYEKHCRAAREIAEEFFDADDITTSMLEESL